MKIIKRLSWFVVVMCGLIPLLLYTLLATTTGSRWVIQQALDYSGQAITVGTISGDLLDEITLYQVTLTDPAATIGIDQVTLNWRPLDLFEQQVSVGLFAIEGLQITLTPSVEHTKNDKPQQPWQLPTISSPWPITVEQLRIADATVVTSEQTLLLTNVSASSTLQGSELAVRKLHVEHERGQLDVNLTLDLQQAYPLDLSFVLTGSAAASSISLPSAQMSGTLSGDTTAVSLTAAIELTDHADASAALTASLSELQTKPVWRADVNVSKLPLAVVQPWLPATEYDLESMLQSAVVTSKIAVTPERIELTETVIQGLSKDRQGQLELSADITQYLSYANQPEQVQFNLNALAQDITLPQQTNDSATQRLNIADIAVTGSLELYSVAVGSHWTLMNTEDVSFSVAGIGTANSLALSEIEIAHDTFAASLTAQMGWLGATWAAVNITEFDGQLPLFEQQYQLLLSGGFGFINGAISANNVQATVNGTELTANGALSPNSTLAVKLRVPNLENWVDSPYAEAQVELSTGIRGDYLRQLEISIDSLALNSEPFGQWLTTQASQLTLALDTFNVAGTPLCLHEQRDRNPATMCLDTQLETEALIVKVDATKLPLRLLNRLRESDVAERIWGSVDATAAISIARSDGTIGSMSGVFRSENTAITSLDDNLTSRLRDWELRWNGNLQQITATVQAYVEDDMGQILGDLSLTNVLAEQTLEGSLDLAINDLTLLQWILPDLRYVGASAIANIVVAGSLPQPTFTGAIELVADEIGFAQSGLLLTKVRIALEDKLEQTGLLSLQGQARSGGGWISLDGEIDLPKRELTLDIDGDTFRAVELAMAEVDVSPDLQVKVANQRIDITGTVTIPYAQINEPDLTSSATVSKDVRLLVNGEPVTTEDDALYPIHANIRVILSDQVAINAYGFEGNVSGSIRLIEEPNRALRATGSIQVAEGNYEIYGQQLEIQRGVLIYNGGAIDNPGLDLRVVRSAASMTAAASDQISVGAQVGGTLLAPDFRLFSSPTMQDAEILSYLILGRPPGGGGSNNLQLQALLLIGSQGTDLIGKRLQDTFGLDEFGIDSTADPLDTSFYIGKYLSPKLYVKYGVGLFENTNTFYIRYLLTDKLIIESTTSTEAQGGDILYTIEK